MSQKFDSLMQDCRLFYPSNTAKPNPFMIFEHFLKVLSCYDIYSGIYDNANIVLKPTNMKKIELSTKCRTP